jgi:hypothetical protein
MIPLQKQIVKAYKHAMKFMTQITYIPTSV